MENYPGFFKFFQPSKLRKIDGYKGKAVADSECGYKRPRAVEIDDVFEHGMVFRPKNPYFVAKLRMKRKNELYVPTDVIKDHKLKLPQDVILLNEEKRKCSSKVIKWNDGRIWAAGGGWKAFCKWNGLKLEDRCLCKFVKGQGLQGLYLKMRILRAGSWFPKGDQSRG